MMDKQEQLLQNIKLRLIDDAIKLQGIDFDLQHKLLELAEYIRNCIIKSSRQG
jgi:hypothetical protein